MALKLNLNIINMSMYSKSSSLNTPSKQTNTYSPLPKPDFSSLEQKENSVNLKGSHKKKKPYIPDSPVKKNEKYYTPIKMQNVNLNHNKSTVSRKLFFGTEDNTKVSNFNMVNNPNEVENTLSFPSKRLMFTEHLEDDVSPEEIKDIVPGMNFGMDIEMSKQFSLGGQASNDFFLGGEKGFSFGALINMNSKSNSNDVDNNYKYENNSHHNNQYFLQNESPSKNGKNPLSFNLFNNSLKENKLQEMTIGNIKGIYDNQQLASPIDGPIHKYSFGKFFSPNCKVNNKNSFQGNNI